METQLETQLESQLETCKYFINEVTRVIVSSVGAASTPNIDPAMVASFAAAMSQMGSGNNPKETKLGFIK